MRHHRQLRNQHLSHILLNCVIDISHSPSSFSPSILSSTGTVARQSPFDRRAPLLTNISSIASYQTHSLSALFLVESIRISTWPILSRWKISFTHNGLPSRVTRSLHKSYQNHILSAAGQGKRIDGYPDFLNTLDLLNTLDRLLRFHKIARNHHLIGLS